MLLMMARRINTNVQTWMRSVLNAVPSQVHSRDQAVLCSAYCLPFVSLIINYIFSWKTATPSRDLLICFFRKTGKPSRKLWFFGKASTPTRHLLFWFFGLLCWWYHRGLGRIGKVCAVRSRNLQRPDWRQSRSRWWKSSSWQSTKGCMLSSHQAPSRWCERVLC